MSDKYNSLFGNTKKTLSEKLKNVFNGTFDEQMYDDFIEALILADVPYETAEKIMDLAKDKLSKKALKDYETVRNSVRLSMQEIFTGNDDFILEYPAIIMIFGVNGVGKTTTIAKLANIFKKEGKSVLLAAADTFRAAACEQLDLWAQRLGVRIVKSAFGQDPSSVIFDAIASAKAKNYDIVICDTAGRLQNKDNLMEELRKMMKVANNNKEKYNLYTVLVLDAMSGKNTLVQTRSFSEISEIDALIMTKTDSSSKGGTILGIADQLSKKIWYIGTGEDLKDIELFNPTEYINGII